MGCVAGVFPLDEFARKHRNDQHGITQSSSYPLYAPLEWSKTAAQEAIRAWTEIFGRLDREALPPGTTLFRESAPPEDVFLLLHGLVLLTCTAPEEGDCTCGLRLPGQIVDQCAHNLGGRYPVSATAIVDSQIFRVALPELRTREEQEPRAAAFFRRMLSLELHDATLCIMGLKKFAPADRLGHFLHLLAAVLDSEARSGSLRIVMPLRDHQIADMLGFSTRQFKRVKRQMHDAGHLLPAGRVWSLKENIRVSLNEISLT